MNVVCAIRGILSRTRFAAIWRLKHRRVRLEDTGERGATLLEAALAATLFGSFIVLANNMVSEEIERKRTIVLGRDLRQLTLSAQSYVSSEHANLRQKLFGAGGQDAELSIELSSLVSAGHLPSAFDSGGGHVNSFGQGYRLLVRGVNRSDNSIPQSTLTGADLDADGDGGIDPELIDGNPSNGEFELEAVLASSGGGEIPPTRGNPAIVASELASAGYVQKDGTAHGPYGNWSLDISEFSGLEGFPEKGRFASLVALSRYGVLNFPNADSGQPSTSHPFERCFGLNENSEAYASCIAGNRIFAEAVFQAYDGNGDGKLDRFGTIKGLHHLQMAPAADTESDGDLDVFPTIAGILEIACDAAAGAVPATGTLLLDCPFVRLAGNAGIDGELAVGGGIQATGAVDAERFTATALGGADLTKGVFTVELVSMDMSPEVAKPECADASSSPEVFVAPASYASPDGSPLVGVAGFATDSLNSTKWRIGMEAVIDRDSNGDGLADVIALESAHDLALVLGKCS